MEEFLYYALSLENKTFMEGEVLTISAISPQRTFISLFITSLPSPLPQSPPLPTPNTSHYNCSDNNLVSCLISNPTPNTILLIAVAVRDSAPYTLLADRQNITKIGLGEVEVDLAGKFGAVYEMDLGMLAAGERYGEIVVAGGYRADVFDSEYRMFNIRAGMVPVNSSD